MPAKSKHALGILRVLTAFLLASSAVLVTVPSPSFAAAPALDGNCSAKGTVTATCTLTTIGTSDLIIVEVAVYASTAPSANVPTCTGTGCPASFSSRTTSASSGTTFLTVVAEYYGVATAALSAASVAEPTNTDADTLLLVGAFSGVAASPFPGSSGSTTGTASIPSQTLTQATTDITIVGLEGDQTATAETVGTGFTSVNSITFAHGGKVGSGAFEYEQVAAGCTSACTINYGATATNWAIITDAIQSTTSVPEFPFGFVILVVPTAVIYFLLRRKHAVRNIAGLNVSAEARV